MGRGRPLSGPQHDDWEAKRDIIQQLYISEGKSLKTVRAIMFAEHQFSATSVFWISHFLTLAEISQQKPIRDAFQCLGSAQEG